MDSGPFAWYMGYGPDYGGEGGWNDSDGPLVSVLQHGLFGQASSELLFRMQHSCPQKYLLVKGIA